MIDSWQLLQVQSGGPAQPFEYMHSHAPLHPSGVEPSHQGTPLHKDTGIAESRSCLTGTHKLCSLPRSMIIDVLVTGVLDRLDPKQLLSSAVRFSNVIYRVMLTVDFLPAIKVA